MYIIFTLFRIRAKLCSRSVVAFLENKVKAASAKIKLFVDSNLKSRQNALFQNNQTQLYK